MRAPVEQIRRYERDHARTSPAVLAHVDDQRARACQKSHCRGRGRGAQIDVGEHVELEVPNISGKLLGPDEAAVDPVQELSLPRLILG